MKIFKDDKSILLLLMAVSIGLRFLSFFPSVLDHDESTYLIIGRDILNGKELYTDVTDTKPVGIFLFYAALEYLFGGSIFLKRLVFSLVVGFTSFLVYKVSLKIFRTNKAALASGLIYIFYTSIWTYHGRSPNTELLFNLTTIGALLLFFRPKLISWIFAGLLMGIGFIIKYLVLFDVAAFMLFFFVYEILSDRSIINRSHFWMRYMIAGIMFLAVFGLTNLYFWFDDTSHEFFYVTYELPKQYGSHPSVVRYIIMLLDFTGKFLPISFFIVYVLSKNMFFKGWIKWFFILWILSILVAIYLPGKEFSHYTIQLMLPLSLIAGLFFHPDLIKDKLTATIFTGKYGALILVILISVLQVIFYNNDYKEVDYPRKVAERIRQDLNPGEQVYVGNYEQIVYYLLEQESPTKYVHPNLLFTDTHKAFKIDVNVELNKIMDPLPGFVVIERENVLIEQYLKERYQLIEELDQGKIRVYELL